MVEICFAADLVIDIDSRETRVVGIFFLRFYI